MRIDNQLVFDPAGTAITVSAASTNSINLTHQQDFGIGCKLAVKVYSNNAFAAAGAATLNIQFQGAPNNGGVAGTYETLAESGPLSIAQLNGSTQQSPSLVTFDWPRRLGTPPQFVQLNYVVATGPFTSGTLQAFTVLGDGDETPDYPSGFTVNN